MTQTPTPHHGYARTGRSTIRRLLVAAALLALAVTTPAFTATGASFTAQAASADTATVEMATLTNLTGVSATRDETGQAAVSWQTPTTRADVAPAYTVERSIDGVTSTITPTITDTAGTTRFTDDLTVPATIEGKTVTGMSAGVAHTCVIADGAPYCWGWGSRGALGNGGTAHGPVPVPVDTSGVLAGKTVTAISAGLAYSCAVADGAVYCWGAGGNGQLGNGAFADSTVPVAVDASGVLAGKIVTTVATGVYHTCAIADGAAYCWGLKGYGALGNTGSSDSNVPVAVNTSGVLDGKTVTAITVGDLHSCAIADGVGACWGGGVDGQLGNNSSSNVSVPVAVMKIGPLTGKTFTDISASGYHTCAVADGAAYCWGDGEYGRLGNADTGIHRMPVPVDTSGVLAGKTVTAVSADQSHSCAVADGAAYCWGNGTDQRLGNGGTASSTVPVAVSRSGVLAGKTVTAIGAGQHTCALADGAVACWGLGYLGDHSWSSSSMPKAVDTSGALGDRVCAVDWAHTAGDRCAPGAAVTVTYTIGYTKAGWSPPASAGVTATWTTP